MIEKFYLYEELSVHVARLDVYLSSEFYNISENYKFFGISDEKGLGIKTIIFVSDVRLNESVESNFILFLQGEVCIFAFVMVGICVVYSLLIFIEYLES